MSYCRYSSSNWSSDIYCYYSVGDFYSINVANYRRENPKPFPEYPDKYWELPTEDFQKCIELERAWLDGGKLAKIGLKYDGCVFEEKSAKDALDCLLLLRETGYNVPQYAIDNIKEESLEK